MFLRRSRPRDACLRLRMAVEAMPVGARRAMLRGIEENTIIVGAYADSSIGGVCPMLAAHRNGERISLASFARSWDRYTDADGRHPRRATARELRTLRALLECSLAEGADFPGPEPAPEPRRKWEPRRWAEMVVRRKPSSGPAEIAEPPLIIR